MWISKILKKHSEKKNVTSSASETGKAVPKQVSAESPVQPAKKQETCRICGRQFRTFEWVKKGMCAECWKQKLAELRTFTTQYHERMRACLADHGVEVPGPSTEGLDDRGLSFRLPDPGYFHHILQRRDSGSIYCIPLRRDTKGIYNGDECGIFTVEARGIRFALPDNGVGIRYIVRNGDHDFLGSAFHFFHGRMLALASDGQDLYGLTDDGMIRSTVDGWKEIRLFDKLDEIRRIADDLSPSGTREAAVKEILDGRRWTYSSGSSEYYYDVEQKAFIMGYESGCSHEGIDRVFTVCSRESLLCVSSIAFPQNRKNYSPFSDEEFLIIGRTMQQYLRCYQDSVEALSAA